MIVLGYLMLFFGPLRRSLALLLSILSGILLTRFSDAFGQGCCYNTLGCLHTTISKRRTRNSLLCASTARTTEHVINRPAYCVFGDEEDHDLISPTTFKSVFVDDMKHSNPTNELSILSTERCITAIEKQVTSRIKYEARKDIGTIFVRNDVLNERRKAAPSHTVIKDATHAPQFRPKHYWKRRACKEIAFNVKDSSPMSISSFQSRPILLQEPRRPTGVDAVDDGKDTRNNTQSMSVETDMGTAPLIGVVSPALPRSEYLHQLRDFPVGTTTTKHPRPRSSSMIKPLIEPDYSVTMGTPLAVCDIPIPIAAPDAIIKASRVETTTVLDHGKSSVACSEFDQNRRSPAVMQTHGALNSGTDLAVQRYTLTERTAALERHAKSDILDPIISSTRNVSGVSWPSKVQNKPPSVVPKTIATVTIDDSSTVIDEERLRRLEERLNQLERENAEQARRLAALNNTNTSERVVDDPHPHSYDSDEASSAVSTPTAKATTKLTIQGGSLKTWSFLHPSVERVVAVLNTDGRPLSADLALWQGPDNTPQRVRIYSENGSLHPFTALIDTPRCPNTIAIRNTGLMEFPLSAHVAAESTSSVITSFSMLASASNEARKTIQGGAVHIFHFDLSIESVIVRLTSDGRPLNARIELLQGPTSIKQVVEVYTEDGANRTFLMLLQTPGSGNVVSVVNTGTLEFPLTACVAAYSFGETSVSMEPVIGGEW